MKKIYKLYIGVLLSVIAVSCTDSLTKNKQLMGNYKSRKGTAYG